MPMPPELEAIGRIEGWFRERGMANAIFFIALLEDDGNMSRDGRETWCIAGTEDGVPVERRVRVENGMTEVDALAGLKKAAPVAAQRNAMGDLIHPHAAG